MPIAYPYKFSDWYGYDKDCVTLTSFSSGSGQTDVKFVCTQSVNKQNTMMGQGLILKLMIKFTITPRGLQQLQMDFIQLEVVAIY